MVEIFGTLLAGEEEARLVCLVSDERRLQLLQSVRTVSCRVASTHGPRVESRTVNTADNSIKQTAHLWIKVGHLFQARYLIHTFLELIIQSGINAFLFFQAVLWFYLVAKSAHIIAWVGVLTAK